MDSGELIELFYNRTYEKFVDKQILDDKNFIVPRQQLTNYVNELVNIPYIDFIDYFKHNETDRNLDSSDITQFSSFSTCGIEMCKALMWANNPGCQYADIGRFFPDMLISRSESAYRRLGEIHIKASTQLGLTFEYYNYWYLSCLGYIFPELKGEVRVKLIARTILRNRLYQQMLVDIMKHDINLKDYISMFSGYNFKRCLRSVCFFLEICLDNCRKEGIKIYNLIRKHETTLVISKYSLLFETTELLKKHFIEIGREPLLSVDEEVELLGKYKRGDYNAFERIIKSNMRFIPSVARQYLHQGLEFDDLLQEGYLGLINAVNHYDVRHNLIFRKYALWWIRRFLSNAIAANSLLIGVPFNVQDLHKKVTSFKEKFEQENGFMPSITDIEIDGEDNLERISFFDSLPSNLKDTCIPCENLDVFEDIHNDILDYEDNESHKLYVNSLLTHLSKRERNILVRVFGIGVKEEKLEHIGDTFGLTRERVRQIKEKAIKKLREIIESSNDKEQDDQIDEKSKKNKLIIEEIERRKRVHSILKKASDKKYNAQTSKEEKKKESVSKRYEGIGLSAGDRILYNSMPCVVLEKTTKYNITRLKIMYDDGRVDDVPGDPKRVEALNRQEDDSKQGLSTPTPQKEIVEQVDIPNYNKEIQPKKTNREVLFIYYKQLVMKLNQAIVHGKKNIAKPSLLVAVIDSIDSKEIRQNNILITTSLEKRYNKIFAKYTGQTQLDRLTSIAMPFWHLQSDKLWFLGPQFPKKKNFSPSKKWLVENVKYARLDDDLWYLLQDETWRNKLRSFIIEKKLMGKSAAQNKNEQIERNDKHPESEKKDKPQFLLSTSLSYLVGFGIITKKQLKHCHKKKLWTIGDVKKKIEYYHLTPNSTRFTKYTLDMWFGIIGLLNNNV